MMDDNAMQKLSYGLFVVTAHEGGKDNGCITNTVSQVTIKPNRITLAVDKSNYTHDMIVRTGEFNVSILSEDASFDTFKHWGFQSGRTIDKAAGIEFSRADNGVYHKRRKCGSLCQGGQYNRPWNSQPLYSIG